MQIVTGRRGEPHVTSRQMQAVYRSFLGDFALLDIGEKLRAEAYSNDIVRVYDGVVSVQGIYAVIAYNQYDEVYIEPVSVGKKRIDTIVLHYTKDNTLDVEDMQLDVVQGDEYTDNPIAPVVPEGGDAWEGTTDIQVPIYDVEVTNFGLTVTPYVRMLTVIPTLESIAERLPETFVTGVKGDSEVSYRDGNVNITKANIGLGNVDNTADTDKPVSTATQTAINLKADLTYVDAKISAAYHAGGSKTVAELTSALLIADNIGKVYNMSNSGVTTSDFVEGAGEPINEGDNVGICNVGTEESPVYKFDLLSGFVDLSAYATTSAVNAGLEGKVDKEAGKGLSTEDYTTEEKTKLAGIEAEANKTIVDSSMSTTSENPLQNKVITAELASTKTTNGNPITVNDAAPVNAVNLSIDLEPIQAGSGTPSPDNIRPISGRSELEIDRVGKNLVDVNAQNTDKGYVNGYYLMYDGQLASGFSGFVTEYIKLPRSSSYITLSGLVGLNPSICFYDSENNYISGTKYNNNSTITVQKPTNAVSCRLSVSDDVANTIQLELGSTATTYEPYAGKTYTIQFGQTVYGAHLDATKGGLVVDTASVDLGSLSWVKSSTGNKFFATLSSAYPNSAYNVMISSCYEFDGYGNSERGYYPENGKFRYAFPATAYEIYITDERYSDATAFKEAVTGQTLVYKLATPFTIDLTPQQIKLLKGTNNITCNTGDLSIKYYPDNVLGQLKGDIESEYDDRVETLETQVQELQPSLIFMSRERRDITSDLSRLSTAVAEQNLAKYGYKIGDYFTGASRYTYILADYNTFKGTSTPYCLTQNHLGIVVDTHQTSQWHSGDASDVGYNGSTLHTYLKSTVMDNIKADMIALFGGLTGLEHLLSHSKLLTTALENWGWQSNQYISALSEVQIFGSRVWGANGYQTGEAAKKLELFDKYKWTEIFGGEYPWLRDLYAASSACYLNAAGNTHYYTVPNGNFVIGLINFY